MHPSHRSGALEKPEIVIVLGGHSFNTKDSLNPTLVVQNPKIQAAMKTKTQTFVTTGDADRMMSKLDTDPDDQVTYLEWVQYMSGVKKDRGEAFLNSIIRFWDNRAQEAIQAAKLDALRGGDKSLSREEVDRIKAIWGVVDRDRNGVEDKVLLIVDVGGDMENILAECNVSLDGKVLYRDWQDCFGMMKKERGGSYIEAILDVMEKRQQDTAEALKKQNDPNMNAHTKRSKNRLTSIQSKKGIWLYDGAIHADVDGSGDLDKGELCVLHGGEVDVLFEALEGDEKGVVMKEAWLQYLLQIKKSRS